MSSATPLPFQQAAMQTHPMWTLHDAVLQKALLMGPGVVGTWEASPCVLNEYGLTYMALVYLFFPPNEIIGPKHVLSILEVKLSESLSQKERSLPPPCSFWSLESRRRGVEDSEEQPGQELMKQLPSGEGRQEQPGACRGRNSKFPLCVLHLLIVSVPARAGEG